MGIPNTPYLSIFINADEATWEYGYVSNWKKGLNTDAVIEMGNQEFNKDKIGEIPFPSAAATGKEETQIMVITETATMVELNYYL